MLGGARYFIFGDIARGAPHSWNSDKAAVALFADNAHQDATLDIMRSIRALISRLLRYSLCDHRRHTAPYHLLFFQRCVISCPQLRQLPPASVAIAGRALAFISSVEASTGHFGLTAAAAAQVLRPIPRAARLAAQGALVPSL
jgi:hypothetical protein